MSARFSSTFEIEAAKAATHADKTRNRGQNERPNDLLDSIQQVKVIEGIFNMWIRIDNSLK